MLVCTSRCHIESQATSVSLSATEVWMRKQCKNTHLSPIEFVSSNVTYSYILLCLYIIGTNAFVSKKVR